jgi:signal transduction histidine kinase
MNSSRPFILSRWRIAGQYTAVMSLILSLGAFCVYRMMEHVHWNALHQRIESLAGTFHDGLEPVLKEPGKIEPEVNNLLPGLCWQSRTCIESAEVKGRHVLGLAHQDGLYLRFLTQSGLVLATLGEPAQKLPISGFKETWQTIQISKGERYHHLSLLLKTQTQKPWGYMQVGRSLQDFDAYLNDLRWILSLGLPVVLIFTAGASWWLSGIAIQPAYHAYRQIQQFTADAAHELRTPLTAIQATIEATLYTSQLSISEAKNTFQTLERQNLRLSQLVQDLLMLSRMDLNTLPVKHQPCCLNDIVNDLVEELAALAIASSIDLTAVIKTSYEVWILGNEEQLYRLISNLITNAIQYTLEGGKVVVFLQQDDHFAMIQIQDTGIGIAKADQKHIFDRFYRVQSDRSRQTGGAGLGLSIVQAIVQAHSGKIQVQSEPGQGSLFTVRLPLHQRGKSKRTAF